MLFAGSAYVVQMEVFSWLVQETEILNLKINLLMTESQVRSFFDEVFLIFINNFKHCVKGHP